MLLFDQVLLFDGSFTFIAILSFAMVLFLSLVTTACSLVCCIWLTIKLFKKLCIGFCFCHYLWIEIAERMDVIQWESIARLVVRKIYYYFWCPYKVHIFLKTVHVLSSVLLMFYLFCQQCALICSVVFDYFYVCVDYVYVHWPEI